MDEVNTLDLALAKAAVDEDGFLAFEDDSGGLVMQFMALGAEDNDLQALTDSSGFRAGALMEIPHPYRLPLAWSVMLSLGGDNGRRLQLSSICCAPRRAVEKRCALTCAADGTVATPRPPSM